MAADSRNDQYEAVRTRLETQYEMHCRRLAELSMVASDAVEAFTKDAMMASSQRALGEITRALRSMDEGRYGRCEQCGNDIPLERLKARPEARSCVACLQRGRS